MRRSGPPKIEEAQHRFLEVLVSTQQNRGQCRGEPGDPLLALCVGLSSARRSHSEDATGGPLGPVLIALEDLVYAVRAELASASPRGRFGTPGGRGSGCPADEE
jgi:hypothetical protein